VANYDTFAQFYDRATSSNTSTIDRVAGCIARYLPSATSLLELGCGTGTVLAAMAAGMDVTGVDLSPGMLAVAAGKVPATRLVEADITSIALDRTFDVVICVSDTINHLLSFERWVELFDRAYEHLTEDGLFLFDVNTVGNLRRICRNPANVRAIGQDLLVIDVTPDGDLATWDVRVFEHIGQDIFRLHHEKISEIGVPIARIRSALARNFKVLEEEDGDGGSVTDESRWAFLACRKAARQ
jgi:SAM-dependent methyltransferase